MPDTGAQHVAAAPVRGSATASRPKRLLAFGINYAPEPTGIALNTTWLSEGLVRSGWEVTVVAGVPHYPSWRPQRAPRCSVNHGVRVIRRRHYVPRRPSTLSRGAYELSWLASALLTLPPGRNVDLVVGVVPSLGGAALAAAAATRYRIPCALLFQDLVGRAAALSGFAGADRVAGPVHAVETGLARRASRIGIVAEGFRDYFLEAGVDPARIDRVRNPARLGPIREPRQSVRAKLGWTDGEFVALHSGSMGYKQGLETVIRAAALASGTRDFRFVLQGDGNRQPELAALARGLALGNVDFLPIATQEEFPSILAAADALLLCQRGSVCNMSMPAKLASYFAAGVPVIAAVAQEDETAREIEAARAGLVVEPERPDLLLAACKRLRRDPREAARLGAAGRDWARRHLSEEAALEGMTRFLEAAALAGRPAPRGEDASDAAVWVRRPDDRVRTAQSSPASREVPL